MKYIGTPCAECPWRKDVAPGRFPPERFQVLADCARDISLMIFACHKSPPGGEFACAGFLLQQGGHNLAVRLARERFHVSSPYPLHPNYRAMAIANGLDEYDPALRNCRDDGQMWTGG